MGQRAGIQRLSQITDCGWLASADLGEDGSLGCFRPLKDDRFQVISEYDADSFLFDPDYFGIHRKVTVVVRAVGKKPSEVFLTETRSQLTEKRSTQTSWMYRDLQKGAPVEAEQIIGDLVARARRTGINTPLLDAAFAHLSI
jgi:hypothetical protein